MSSGERVCPLVDERALCVTGQVCPARLALIAEYEPNAYGAEEASAPDQVVYDELDEAEAAFTFERTMFEQDGDDDWGDDDVSYGRPHAMLPTPETDSLNLRLKLAENTAAAKVTSCSGPDGEVCPTRVGMDNSNLRSGILKAIRKVTKRV